MKKKTEKSPKGDTDVPAEKEIKIETPETVETLLKEAKAEKPPITPKKKETRGRPRKKRKPDADLNQYIGNPIATTVNQFLVMFGNKLVQTAKKGVPLTREESLTEKDCQIGEALCYTVDYYGLELAHPIVMLLIATGTFGWAVFHKTLGAKKALLTKKVEQ